MKKYKHSLLYTALMAALSLNAYAEETPIEESLTEEILAEDVADETESATLETIVVTDSSFSQQVGTQKVTAEQISRMPSKNGGITDVLKSNPNVRFSNAADLSTNAGEISPNEVSFHGEKYYNNNFIIDGMSNNDNMNPSGNIERNGTPVGSAPYDLPNGNSQSMWIDASLLKSVEAFDSNVSAKYGNFTGGVVDAQLKDPSFEKQRSGKIYYRTTRDDWTTFYIQEGKEEEFNKATRLDYQPKFVKQSFGISASEKLSDKFALMFSYDRTQSDIDYYHTTMHYTADLNSPVPNEQKRTNETYLFRGVYLPDNGDLIRGTFIYSPHKSKLFKSNVKNGEFSSEGGGVQFNLEWEKQLNWGKMKSYAGYKKTGDKIEHQEGSYHRYSSSSNLDWTSNGTYSTWGGYGTYYNEKEIYTLKQDFDVDNFAWGDTEHNITFGWKVDLSQAKYKRDNDNTLYYYRTTNSVSCGVSDACIDGDQYSHQKTVYEARNVKAKDSDYAIYLQDAFKWKRLELNIGARLDYNEFLGNTNLAHRISGSYDVFGDQSTRIFAGFNRYYGASMLAYKLRQGIGSGTKYVRSMNADGTLGDWTKDGTQNAPTKYMMTKVKTPYADEKVLGLAQRIYNTTWTVKWVHRDSRDQFSSSYRIVDATAYRVLNNNGWTKNDTVTLTVAPQQAHKFKYANISWDAGMRISRTKSNNQYYDVSATLNEKAIYNGRLIDAIELPSNDFNTPWSAFFNLNTHFPSLNLNWDQRFTFTEGKKVRVSDDSVSCNGIYSYNSACGSYVGDAAVYEDQEMGSSFMVDWRFAYKVPTYKDQFFEITLDVNNVLNKKVLAKSSGTRATYKQGRNFWLGASYNW